MWCNNSILYIGAKPLYVNVNITSVLNIFSIFRVVTPLHGVSLYNLLWNIINYNNGLDLIGKTFAPHTYIIIT